METKVKVLHWLPRIICILAILFVSMFALDSFASGLTIWQQLAAFAMHLVPSFVLIVFLIVAWKWEFIGGIIFLTIGLAMSPFIFNMNYHRTNSIEVSLGIILMITFPFIVVGVLFIISHSFKKKNL